MKRKQEEPKMHPSANKMIDTSASDKNKAQQQPAAKKRRPAGGYGGYGKKQ